MRPRGEIRQALAQAARDLAPQHGGATWRDMAMCARVGFAAAKRTTRNMVRAGELVAVAEVRFAHSKRPMVLLAPAARSAVVAGDAPADAGALARLIQGWATR